MVMLTVSIQLEDSSELQREEQLTIDAIGRVVEETKNWILASVIASDVSKLEVEMDFCIDKQNMALRRMMGEVIGEL